MTTAQSLKIIQLGFEKTIDEYRDVYDVIMSKSYSKITFLENRIWILKTINNLKINFNIETSIHEIIKKKQNKYLNNPNIKSKEEQIEFKYYNKICFNYNISTQVYYQIISFFIKCQDLYTQNTITYQELNELLNTNEYLEIYNY